MSITLRDFIIEIDCKSTTFIWIGKIFFTVNNKNNLSLSAF